MGHLPSKFVGNCSFAGTATTLVISLKSLQTTYILFNSLAGFRGVSSVLENSGALCRNIFEILRSMECIGAL